ncbi:AAA family ATPase [Candidatus Woesearchaeota archaeon]|nr:AAA family ATPase [Candidatus Woesearchaeota archaeon]
MGVWDDVLRENESLFRDSVALSYDYIPKLVPFRELEQKRVAACIKPLFSRTSGRNILVYGLPGVGKTVAIRHVLEEIEDHTEDIVPLYINCWKKNTSYKILLEICDLIGYKLTHNKNTQDLFGIIKERLNKYSVVFCFDEVDKLEDTDFLYFILEDIYRASIVLITNYKSWLAALDERIKSRLTPELLEFRPYNDHEVAEILKQRLQYAFVPGVWPDDAFALVVRHTTDYEDVRAGLYLLKETTILAEEAGAKKVTRDHVDKAVAKMQEFTIKQTQELEDDARFILALVKENSGKRIGDVFAQYQEKGGMRSYKSFQRKIQSLADAQFIDVEKVTDAKGNTTILMHKDSTKKLTDF